MDEPLMDVGQAYQPLTAMEDGTSGSFSRFGRSGDGRQNGGASVSNQAEEEQTNIESIDYLPANNTPWRKHVMKQEKMKSNW